MRRINTIIFILAGISACAPARLDYAFKDLHSTPQIVEGDLAIVSTRSIRDCTEYAKDRVVNKFLYEGFEGTSVWRPREITRKKVTSALTESIKSQIYITHVRNESKGKRCNCHFQLNLASTRKILEDEGIIPALGY